jgi:diguanylate cyclase (GGDEF)-like protein
MKIINKRYKIVEELGTDFYGTQFVVLDLSLKKEQLILKIIHPQFSNTEYTQYFTNEFLFMASVQHANIQQDFRFDIIKHIDNRAIESPLYFFTSEYFDETQAIDYRTLDFDETMKVLIELCYSINYLHFRDIAYKYLSFDTFWIYRSEKGLKVKLKSMANMYGYNEAEKEYAEQTSQFFAPEIRKSAYFGLTVDIYSMGIVAYYLTSQKDFRHSDIKSKFNRYANNPLLNDLIQKAISYDSAERYLSIDAYLQDFKRVCPYPYDFIDKDYYQKLNFNTKLIGRERVLTELFENVNSRLHNMVGIHTALVTGAPGLGKSRLLREVYYRGRLNNLNTYTFEGQIGESGAYTCFSELVREMTRNLAPNDELIVKYGSELVKVIPEMRTVWRIEPSPALRESREKLKINNRIVNFIADYAQLNPTLIILDNIDFLSENEKTIMDSLLVIDRELPLFLLYSYDQSVELGPERIDEWLANPKVKLYELDNFSINEASEHIRNILSMSNTPTRLASYIVSETYGNPRYVEEVIKNLYLHQYIFVHENRRWFVNQDDLTDIALPESMDIALADSYHSVDDLSKRILEAISIFNKPVSKSIILAMIGLEEDLATSSIQNLVNLKILGIKFSDWGYTYDFYNKALGRLIVHELEAAYRNTLHFEAAKIVETFYLTDGTNGDSLIYHLENSKKYEKAVPYAIELAKKMYDLNIFSQAIEFYQKARDLINHLDDPVMLCRVEKAIAEIYTKTGEIDQALVLFYEVVSLSNANGIIIDYVDAIHQILEIKLIKREVFDYETLINEALQNAKDHDYIEGILENGLIRCKLVISKGEFEEADELIEEYLRLSFRFQQDYYIGRMLNQKGLLAGIRESYDEAFRSYVEAIKYLERGSEPSEISRPLNNLGVIALNAVGDIQKAREYFIKAVDATERFNVVTGKDFYLCNLGETYILEDKLAFAIEKNMEAEALANDSDNKEIKFQIYYNLGLSFLTLCNFKETSRYLRKIEQEYLVIQSMIADIGFDNYYVLNFEYALKSRDFKTAEVMSNRLNKESFQFTDSYSQFNLKLLKLYYGHIAHPEWQNGYLDMEHFRIIKSIASSPVEEKLLRVMLAEMILDLLSNQLEEAASALYAFYDTIERTLTTERIELLDAIIGCMKANDRCQYIESLLQKFRVEIGHDARWRLYLILATDYDQKGNYYSALLNYLNSLDALKGILLLMPEENRMAYLTGDYAKNRLKHRINQLIHSIYDHELTDEAVVPMTLYEDYFVIQNLPKIFSNKIFTDSVKIAYQKRFDLELESAEDLFQYFRTDQRHNLELVLKYQMQICLAETACLYLLDENGKLTELITPTPEQEPPEFKKLLKNRTVSGEGIVVSNNTKVTNLSDNRDAIIFMPIYRIEEDHPDLSRRRYDPISTKQVLMGYLYLHTDKLLNNFTEKAFEEIESLRNLLVVLIDNYDLKKASSVDKLTGVFQRRFIEHQFKRILAEANRNKSLLSIVMADIDHFKNVNDLYGHQKGDEILRKIGDILKTHVRKGDLVGRYGGEEFIILLPKTGEMDAYNVCEKLRNYINDRKLLGDDQTLTLSFGISTYPLHGAMETELVEKADKALYESKNNGRNQTTLWSQNLIYNNQRYDKLAGIMTGNLSSDTRVVKSIVDVMTTITKDISKKEKLFDILSIIVDIVEASQVCVIIERDHEVKQVYTRKKGLDRLLTDQSYNVELYDRFKQTSNGDFFIHWNDTEEIDPILKTPDWKSYCVVPIINGDKRTGMIMAMTAISAKEFNFNDFNFIQTISGLLSKI